MTTSCATRTSPSLAHAESYEGGRHRFEADVALDQTGPFGYTVRILPKHAYLASSAEVGVVAWPLDVNEEADAL